MSRRTSLWPVASSNIKVARPASRRAWLFSAASRKPPRYGNARVSINPMMKITTASSSSVKPGEADDTLSRTSVLARRADGPGPDFMAPSRRLAGVYIVRAFDAVGAERLQHVRVPIALVEVGRPPGILRQALDIAAAFVIRGHAAVGRRRHQRVQTLVGGRVVAVVEVVAIERGLDLGEISLRLGLLGLVGGAAQTLDDDRREQAEDQNNHHDFNQGETVLIVSA